MQALRQRKGLGPSARFLNHRDIGCAFEPATEPLAKQWFLINQKERDHDLFPPPRSTTHLPMVAMATTLWYTASQDSTCRSRSDARTNCVLDILSPERSIQWSGSQHTVHRSECGLPFSR